MTWRSLFPFLVFGMLLTGFAAAQDYPTFVLRHTPVDPDSGDTGQAFKEVALADLNDDDRLDLYLPQKQGTVAQGSNLDILYLSEGGDWILAVDDLGGKLARIPTTTAFPQALATSRAYDVEVVDLDGDGALDIIRPDRYGHVDVWWGQQDPQGAPTGLFGQLTNVLASPNHNPNAGCTSINGNYDDVAVGFVNNDTLPDFAVVQRQTSCSTAGQTPVHFLVENVSTPGQHNASSFMIRSDGGELPARWSSHAVSFGNVDPTLGSTLDMVFAEWTGARLYRGDGSFGFTADPLLSETFMNNGLAVADLVHLNGDNKLDLFVAENDINGTTHGVYFHDSQDDVDPFPEFLEACPIDYAALGITAAYQGIYDARYGDLDADGTTEIVVVNQNVDNDGNLRPTAIQVLRIAASNGIQDVTAAFMEAASGLKGGMGIELGDLDNDGDLDMVLAGASMEVISPSTTEELFAAAPIYENRTVTRLQDRTFGPGGIVLSEPVVALRELTAGAGVNVESGATVTFQAGEAIVLEPGFHAKTGSRFTAEIITISHPTPVDC